MKKIALMGLLLAGCFSLSAQEPQNPEENPQSQPAQRMQQRLTPELIAQQKTKKMQEALSLTDKQFNKLYKINLQEAQEGGGMMMRQQRQGGRPQGGGMGPQGQGGERPMGQPGGGMGPQGGMGQPGMGQGPQGGGMQQKSSLTPEQLKKNADKREKQIKKILGADKYAQWQKITEEEMAKQMSEHPQGQGRKHQGMRPEGQGPRGMRPEGDPQGMDPQGNRPEPPMVQPEQPNDQPADQPVEQAADQPAEQPAE